MVPLIELFPAEFCRMINRLRAGCCMEIVQSPSSESDSVVPRSRFCAGAHALSLCSPRPPVSWTPQAQTWDFGWQASPALWTHVACHARLDTSDARASSSQHWLGWFGDLVKDALALILPIWRPASSAKALVDDILLLSAGYFEVLLFMVRSSARTSGRTSWRGRRIVVFSKSVNHVVIGYNIRVVAESHDGVGKAGPGRADAGTRSLKAGVG